MEIPGQRLWSKGSRHTLELPLVDSHPSWNRNGLAKPHAAAGRWFAIKRDGTLWAAGNEYLGHPSISYSDSLIQIGPTGTWRSVAVGNYHNLAIQEDSSLWAWGQNSHGTWATAQRPIC